MEMSQAGCGVALGRTASGRKTRAPSAGTLTQDARTAPLPPSHLVRLAAAAQRPREALQCLQQGRQAGGPGTRQGLQHLRRPSLQSMQLQMACSAAVVGSWVVVWQLCVCIAFTAAPCS